ncbi:hypothetical protein, partial [Hallella colorans]|uniref:hypothetical protein n=1 Tax=Hallella colorans TaxID=1703337 RepID=UPI0023F4E165
FYSNLYNFFKKFDENYHFNISDYYFRAKLIVRPKKYVRRTSKNRASAHLSTFMVRREFATFEERQQPPENRWPSARRA